MPSTVSPVGYCNGSETVEIEERKCHFGVAKRAQFCGSNYADIPSMETRDSRLQMFIVSP